MVLLNCVTDDLKLHFFTFDVNLVRGVHQNCGCLRRLDMGLEETPAELCVVGLPHDCGVLAEKLVGGLGVFN